MDVYISTIEYFFEDNLRRIVELPFDVKTTKLSIIRTNLLSQSCPHESISPYDWNYEVDNVLISPLDAQNRYGHLGMVIKITRKKKLRVVKVEKTKKRERIDEEDRKEVEKIYKETEGIPYETTRHLARVMRENDLVFKREVESNGVIHEWIFMMMGHFSVKLPKVALPVKSKRLVFETTLHGPYNNMDFVLRYKRDEKQYGDAIVVCPYITMRHVGIMCYDMIRGRLLHFDSSSTLTPLNDDFFKLKKEFKSVSYTYIDYQTYDETNTILSLAGGNCGMFSGLNAIQCILQYNQDFVPFQMFWDRFLQVLKMTPEEKQSRIVLDLTRRIGYCANGNEETHYGRLSLQYEPFLLHLLEHFPSVLRYNYPKWVETCDFTCDYIMLGYFIDAGLGFHEVPKLGNVFRLMMKDIVERGFESVTLNISEAMKRLCSVCTSVEASFECPCTEARYCGSECQKTHWEEHKRKHSLYFLLSTF
jgi:hypothetical protein